MVRVLLFVAPYVVGMLLSSVWEVSKVGAVVAGVVVFFVGRALKSVMYEE